MGSGFVRKVAVIQLARSFTYATSYPVGTEVVVEVGRKFYYGVVLEEDKFTTYKLKPVVAQIGKIPQELTKAVIKAAGIYKVDPAAIFKKYLSFRYENLQVIADSSAEVANRKGVSCIFTRFDNILKRYRKRPVKFSTVVKNFGDEAYEALRCGILKVFRNSIWKVAKEGILTQIGFKVGEVVDKLALLKKGIGNSGVDRLLSVGELVEVGDSFDKVEQNIASDLPQKSLLNELPYKSILDMQTGSGKTTLLLKLAEECVIKNKQALILQPTSFLVENTCARAASMGIKVFKFHYLLSAEEKRAVFEAVEKKKNCIVVGTRSALFLPFENLGLIGIDEEGEAGYFSENPHTDAAYIAGLLAREHNAKFLLSSATPRPEVWLGLREYSLGEEVLSLVGTESLKKHPVVEIVRFTPTATANISDQMKNELRQVVREGKRAIILHNRRGWWFRVVCPKCGATPVCPICKARLVFYRPNRFMCHFCGYTATSDMKCSKCYSKLDVVKAGVDRIERELRAIFGENVFKVDSGVRRVGEFEKILDEFSRSDGSCLVGTQIVSRGMNVRNVAFVGIIDFEDILVGGLDSYWQAFSILKQLVGRGGRFGEDYKVLIQTSGRVEVPEKLLNMALSEFMEREIARRRSVKVSPEYLTVRFTVDKSVADEFYVKVREFSVNNFGLRRAYPPVQQGLEVMSFTASFESDKWKDLELPDGVWIDELKFSHREWKEL